MASRTEPESLLEWTVKEEDRLARLHGIVKKERLRGSRAVLPVASAMALGELSELAESFYGVDRNRIGRSADVSPGKSSTQTDAVDHLPAVRAAQPIELRAALISTYTAPLASKHSTAPPRAFERNPFVPMPSPTSRFETFRVEPRPSHEPLRPAVNLAPKLAASFQERIQHQLDEFQKRDGVLVQRMQAEEQSWELEEQSSSQTPARRVESTFGAVQTPQQPQQRAATDRRGPVQQSPGPPRPWTADDTPTFASTSQHPSQYHTVHHNVHSSVDEHSKISFARQQRSESISESELREHAQTNVRTFSTFQPPLLSDMVAPAPAPSTRSSNGSRSLALARFEADYRRRLANDRRSETASRGRGDVSTITYAL